MSVDSGDDDEIRALIKAVLVAFERIDLPMAIKLQVLDGACAEMHLADAIDESALLQIANNDASA